MFHLLDVGEIIRTENVKFFNDILQGLTARNTSTDMSADPICSRKSLTGIKRGLEVSLPNSHVIVFTDAVPDESLLLPQINTAIATTHSQVHVLAIRAKYMYTNFYTYYLLCSLRVVHTHGTTHNACLYMYYGYENSSVTDQFFNQANHF